MPLARFPIQVYVRTIDGTANLQLPGDTTFALHQNGRIVETMDYLTTFVRAYRSQHPLQPHIMTIYFITLEVDHTAVVSLVRSKQHVHHIELFAAWKVTVDRLLPGHEILITWLTVQDDGSLGMETERCPC